MGNMEMNGGEKLKKKPKKHKMFRTAQFYC